MPSTNIQKDTLRVLVNVVQDLSLAEDLERIMEIVRKEARELTGSDGATFILRDGDDCYYADEDSISPLWKGCRFPMNTCIGGWAIMNRRTAVIEDIYQDPRIPIDVYRSTFVKSMVMVPIRKKDPLGAIGVYWGEAHQPSETEVELIQSIADITAVAMENVNVYNQLEKKVKERTAQVEAFSYSVAHDLKNPLAGMEMRLNSLGGDENFDNESFKEVTEDLYEAISRMQGMIDGLLQLCGLGDEGGQKEWIEMEALVQDVVKRAKTEEEGGQKVEIAIGELSNEYIDQQLFQQAWRNLISNAIKFTKEEANPRIEIGMEERKGERVYWIKDNGCGFRGDKAEELFKAFKKMNMDEEKYPGSGIGLSMVQQIILRHGGSIWADGEKGEGACFFFTLPWKPEQNAISSKNEN